MLIIIEGADGTGKTTLADMLVNQLRLEHPNDKTTYMHYGVPTRHPLVEYELDLQDYRPGKGQHLVIDRYHLGELVYAEIYRNPPGTLLGDAGRTRIELFLVARGAVLVVCDATERELDARLRERGETYLQPEHQGEVLRRFRELSENAEVLMPLVLDEFANAEIVDDILQNASWSEYDAIGRWT